MRVNFLLLQWDQEILNRSDMLKWPLAKEIKPIILYKTICN